MDRDKRAVEGANSFFGGKGAEEVLDSIKDGVTVVDRDYRLVYVNHAVLDSFGFKDKKELLGKTCYKAFFNKDDSCGWCKCKACFETGQPQYSRVSLTDDSDNMMSFDLYTYPFFDGDKVSHVIEVAKDVTDRAKLESRLEKLATIADSSADAMLSVDMEGIVGFWNSGAENLFGHEKDEILGQHFNAIVPNDLREEAETKRKEAQEKGFVRYETLRLRKDGTRVPVDMTLTVIKDEDGRPTSIAGNIKDLTEKKKLEEDYRVLFENAKDGISITNKDGNFVLFNSRFMEMTGYTEAELKDLHFSTVVCPADLAKVTEYDKKRLAGEDVPRSYEFRLVRKDKKIVEVEVTASPITYDDEVVGTQGILRDASERERLESEVREAKTHLESVIDTIEEAICVIDGDLRIISFNESFVRNISTTRDNILGRKCYEVLHDYSDDDFSKICAQECIVREVFKKGETVESVHSHELSGDFLYHESRALPMKNLHGETYQVVYIINDVTKKKKVEEALRESEEKYRNVVESSPDMIFLVERKSGKIIDVNSAACRLLGLPKEEVIGTVSGSRVAPSQKQAYTKEFERLKKNGEYDGEFDVRRKDGSIFTVEVRGAALGNYLIAIGRNVTERKKADEMLKKYASDLESSNKLKDLFADILRHDLLNPLGVIKNVFELLGDEMINVGAEKELSMLHRNLGKIEDLINTATKFGMVESADDLVFEPRDLREILEGVVENLKEIAAKKNIRISLPEGEYVAEVNVFIEEVFSNLISNSIKYGPNDSEISIGIEEEIDWWNVKVIDRGPGVPDESKKEIFERFKRIAKGSVKGSGLGLAIVNKVVELHNGKVWVEDNPGGGSIFIFKIPKKRSRNA
jgi:PAS domain S-box-containing protein